MITAVIHYTLCSVLALALVGSWRALRGGRRGEHRYQEAVNAGAVIPPSLHPVVDASVCIGSGACVDVCHEDVLAVVRGMPHIVDAGSCVGHGACREACPVGAISLVFGSAERGVDLPQLNGGLETNVPGIFVAGELGGMGLIRNAFRQGVLAMESVQQLLGSRVRKNRKKVDVLIVGAGPAGLAAALKAVELGLSYRLLDQYRLGGSLNHFPRKKVVLTERVTLPVVGPFGQPEILKEDLFQEFERIVDQAGLKVREERRVTAVRGRAGSYKISAASPRGDETYLARTIVLAIGRRGTPRRLEVPGEDSSHVVYQLGEPEQYRRRRVLVVGGGDSAIEAALALTRVADCQVHLSYRQRGFSRIKRKNRLKLEEAVADKDITLHLETNVREIKSDSVTLKGPKKTYVLGIDDVIVNVGGVLPTGFLQSMGIEVDTKHGEELETPPPGALFAKRVAQASGRLVRTSTRLATLLRGGDSSQRGRKAG